MLIRVGSRDSKLAVAQSNIIIEYLKSQNHNTSLVTMKTTGDIILDKSLDKIGGKGLFVKELDKALNDDIVDITVHSYKDMPMNIEDNLPIIAVSTREDPRDVLILPKNKTTLDIKKPIGCSSKRRTLQIKKLYDGITVAPVRGNVLTRLSKLDNGEYSALILAYAGIKRLGLVDRVSRIFTEDEILPAACQGIIAVQAKKEFDTKIFDLFNCSDAYYESVAERAFVSTLNGGCSSPVAAFAKVYGNNILLKGFYVNDLEESFVEIISGTVDKAYELGKNLANDMKNKYSR